METRVPRRYFFIPLLYAAIVAALLYVQFTGTVRIHDRIGSIAVSVETPARSGNTRSNIANIVLNTKNLQFAFSEDARAELIMDSGQTVPLSPVGYATTSTDVSITFSRGLTVWLSSSVSEDGPVRIRTEVDSESAAAVAIPFAAPGAVVTRPSSTLPVVVASSSDGSATVVALSSGTFTGSGLNKIVLPVGPRSGPQEALIVGNESNTINPAVFWFSHYYEPVHADEYDSVVREFIDAAYGGWTTSRFSQGAGSWRKPGGEQVFDESILTYVLAEAILRDQYQQRLNAMRNVSVLHPEDLTIMSAPFIDDIVAAGQRIDDLDVVRIQEIVRALENGSPAVYEIPDLLPFLLDRAPFSLVQGLLDFTASTRPEELTLAQAVGAYATLRAAPALGLDAETISPLMRFADIPVERIVPSLSVTEEGVFLTAEGNTADLSLTILAGTLLMDHNWDAPTSNDLGLQNETLRTLGEDMVASALLRADEVGYIPRSISLTDTDVAVAGVITPEEVYPLVSTNPHIPRQRSLYETGGAARWAWTAARGFQVETGRDLRITMQFRVGGTHHFLIRGVEPFIGITMFDIPWRGDPRFQAYSSGWFYEPSSETLYVKITHRTETEQIVIQY